MKVKVCARDELQLGEKRRFEIDGKSLVIGRIAEDEYFALRDICPHLGAELSAGFLEGTCLPTGTVGQYAYGRRHEIIRCPWHGYEFDVRTGEHSYIASRYRVKTYPVTRDEDGVYVELS